MIYMMKLLGGAGRVDRHAKERPESEGNVPRMCANKYETKRKFVFFFQPGNVARLVPVLARSFSTASANSAHTFAVSPRRHD